MRRRPSPPWGLLAFLVAVVTELTKNLPCMRRIPTDLQALAEGLIFSLAGIRQSNKVVDLRLKSLEAKVDKHNHLVERMALVEQHQAVYEERIRVANHRIDDLEKEVKA